jgi:hypothetical protein
MSIGAGLRLLVAEMVRGLPHPGTPMSIGAGLRLLVAEMVRGLPLPGTPMSIGAGLRPGRPQGGE